MLPHEKLVLLRKAKHVRQFEVAQAIGVSTSTIAMMETGERKGSDEVKMKLARYYQRSVEEIFFSSEPIVIEESQPTVKAE